MKLTMINLRVFTKRHSRSVLAAAILVAGGLLAALLWPPPRQDDVLAVANSVSGGGYLLNGTGVPEPVIYDGVEILSKKKAGTHCCGFTLWVAMKVAQQRGLLVGKEPYEIKQFQCEAYGASKASAEREIAMAMENLGIGREIDPNDARAGDFATFQRSKPKAPGHSVIFLDYVRHNGVIVGVRYRSSQPSTSGVGERVEYFTSSGYAEATIDGKRFYVCRLNRR